MHYGDNGILKSAEYAVNKYENAQKTENKNIDDISNEIDNIIKNSTTVGTRNENANNYSTDEQVIGTWIDGKKLYRKVYKATTPSTSESTAIVDISELNVDTQVNIYGSIFTPENGSAYSLNTCFGSTDTVATWFNKTNIYMKVSYTNRQNRPCIIVIEYTKTTDTATK